MGEHFADLGITPLTRNSSHQPRQRLWVANPLARAGFAKPAEIDKLHIKSANLLHGAEHVGLESERKVPGGLPVHGCIHGKNKPSSTGAYRGDGFHARKKGIDLSAARARGFDSTTLLLHWRV